MKPRFYLEKSCQGASEEASVREALKTFSGVISEPAAWADIPAHSDPDLADALDKQAKPIDARTKLLRADLHEALRRSYAEAGYQLVAGSFEAGGAVTTATEVLLYEANGQAYAWEGALPKVIPAASTPYTTGGVADGAWRAVGDVTLRVDLAEDTGAGLIGTSSGDSLQEELDSINGGLATDINSLYRYKIVKTLPLNPPLIRNICTARGYDYMYPQGYCYGNNGDIWLNVTANTNVTWVAHYSAAGELLSIFEAMPGTSEASHFYTEGGQDYYVLGNLGTLKRYNVTSLPPGESVQVPVNTWAVDILYGGCGFFGNKMLIEEQAFPLGGFHKRFRLFVFNLSTGQRETSFDVPLNIAGAFANSPMDPFIHKSQGIAASGRGLFLSHGKYSADGTNTDPQHGVGVSLMNWSGDIESTNMITADAFRLFLIAEGLPATRVENESIDVLNGYPHVLMVYLDDIQSSTATTEGIVICSVGEPSGSTDLSAGAVAPNTGRYFGRSKEGYYNPYSGELMDTIAKMMDYMYATNTEEFSFYTSGFTILDLDGSVLPASNMVRIYNPNNNTFFYQLINTSTQNWYYTTDRITKNYMSFFGSIGATSNTLAGINAGRKITTGVSNTIIGSVAGQNLTTGTGNVLIGQGAALSATTAIQVSALGLNACRWQLDGTTASNFSYSAGIGVDARLSGDLQVQLGAPNATPYAYAALQIRSDARDKTDIRDTVLGLDFINMLRPVDYRWDMRDDYWEEYEEQVGVDEHGNPVMDVMRRSIPKDGSKARTRFHHGLIAQEVKEVIEQTGVDFAGFQDHAVNGGCDVMSVGYDELIAPLIKAVQELTERVKQLENK